ncbi:hypothetical protein EC988_002602 [Linderina pennispora]|nr:hypothetical protein EC988_002602 [Linderina pennispora]
MSIKGQQASQRMPQSNPHRDPESPSSVALGDTDSHTQPASTRRGRPPKVPGIRGRPLQKRSHPRIKKSKEFVVDSSDEDDDSSSDEEDVSILVQQACCPALARCAMENTSCNFVWHNSA